MRPVKRLFGSETNATARRYLYMVRSVVLALALALVAGPLAARPAAASTSDLVQQLDGLVRAFPGGAGIWVSDPRLGSPLFTHAPEEQVIAASLYKLGVLAEAERRVEAGELHYGDAVVIEAEDNTDDGSFVGAGTQLTLDEALEAMITVSDNGTAQALWHILGGANIDATLAKANIADFHVRLDPDEDSWATPRAIGSFFSLLAKRQLISPAASDRMLARLGRQQINNRLPAQLPRGEAGLNRGRRIRTPIQAAAPAQRSIDAAEILPSSCMIKAPPSTSALYPREAITEGPGASSR